MAKVIVDFTMSLDGFIAGPNDDVSGLFTWYGSGDVDFPVAGTDRSFKVSQASADYMHERWGQFGAIVTGRRDFDVSKAWGGAALMGLHMFIVTHHPPPEWVYEGSPFQFVTDGVPSAIAQAKAAAGDKVVAVSGSTIAQQGLNAGLVDEIRVQLAHMLLGEGIRLFDQLKNVPIELERSYLIEGQDVTHIGFRVLK